MTDSNVIYGVDFKAKVEHAEVPTAWVNDVLAQQDEFRRRYLTRHGEPQFDTSPSEYSAPLWHQPGTADANGVPIADEGDCA